MRLLHLSAIALFSSFAFAQTSAPISPLQGKKFTVLGDSISAAYRQAWQKVVIGRTGMTDHSMDARPGRRFYQAFECYGNNIGGTYNAQANPSCGGYNFGMTQGWTLTQNFAQTDLLVIALGTNDIAEEPLGQIGDPTNAGTFYGNMRYVVETMISANPKMRIIMVTPQYRIDYPDASAIYADAEVAYGKSMGIPVLNMSAVGGVNHRNVSVMTRDGLHPSDFDYDNVYGPLIADFILRNM